MRVAAIFLGRTGKEEVRGIRRPKKSGFNLLGREKACLLKGRLLKGAYCREGGKLPGDSPRFFSFLPVLSKKSITFPVRYRALADAGGNNYNEKMKAFRFIWGAVFFFVAFTVSGQSWSSPTSDSTLTPYLSKPAKANGMGGQHAAYADGFDTLFVNPAGFSAATDQFSLASFHLTFSDADTILRLFQTSFTDPSVYAARFKTHFEAGFDLIGPVTIGGIFGPYGWGIMNHQYMKVWWSRSDIFVVNFNVVEEVALYGGRSFPITNYERTVTFTPGVAIKPVFRAVFAPRDVLLVDFRHIATNLEKQPFETQWGIGADFGVLLSFFDTLYFSGVLRDMFAFRFVSRYQTATAFIDGESPFEEFTGEIDPSYSVSLCLRLGGDEVEGLVFAVDYHGMVYPENPDRNPFLDIGAGIELHLLRALWIRVGWQQMLPGGGLGIDFGWGKFDMAIFGETFGDQTDDYQGISLSLGFSFKY
jgi:hypothetical protein